MGQRPQWGLYAAPFIYADDLGPGGRTAPRLAETIGDGNGWYKQLGQLGQFPGVSPPPGGVEDAPCPPNWPEGFPCMLPGSSPQAPMIPIITEEEAAKREAAAFNKGRSSVAGEIVKTAAISAAVSAVVGILIGKFIG